MLMNNLRMIFDINEHEPDLTYNVVEAKMDRKHAYLIMPNQTSLHILTQEQSDDKTIQDIFEKGR